VLKIDAVVEGVHFTRRDPARLVGRKALARAVSDFAAAGATPAAALVACALTEKKDDATFLDQAMKGMATAARAWQIGLVGGETTRAQALALTVSLYGWVKKGEDLRRSGGRPAHSLFVTGVLGGSRKSHHLRFTPRLAEGRWLAEQRFPSAMMDLSDGLGKDLPRLAAASGVSYLIDPQQLPRRPGRSASQAVNDGEDYELLFSVPRERCHALLTTWPFRTRLTCIGGLLPAQEPPRTGGLVFRGFDHFV
jgi:thiamine-monophosphate kinase